jgi:phage tail-like protein
VEHTLRLAAAPDGPLALDAPDDALGRLVLPRGMALDQQGRLYLGEINGSWIKRYDPATQRFVPLPSVGGRGTGPRQFSEIAGIAIAGGTGPGDLYVADRDNRRVHVFALPNLALRHIWGPWDAQGRLVAAEASNAWNPADVAAQGDLAYILDRRYGRVYRHRTGSDQPALVIDEPQAAYRWTRLALDREGRIYLLDPRAPRLLIYDPHGNALGMVQEAGQVRSRFDPPPIHLDHKGRFCLPQSLTRLCDRRPPETPPSPEQPLSACPPWSEGGLVFDRQGQPATVAPAEALGPNKIYADEGIWISEALDSEIYRCQWHRIALDVPDLPPGTRVRVTTYTEGNDHSLDEIRALPDHLWETRYTLTGEMQPPPTSTSGTKAASEDRAPHEFLVQSREGQFLWLKFQLEGDGYATPSLRAIRVYYPRQSYLQYLPAVYSADDDSRWFLERFLSIFETEWDDLEGHIAEMARYFDPDAVPAGPFLTYLAQWLALPLEGSWNGEEKRNLLAAAPDFYPRRGTVDGLRDFLQVYLQNITGLTPAEQGTYPQIVEGFRERRHLLVSMERVANLGRGAPLWSPGMVGRLQLDAFAREGEVRLVSTGDPERDLFHEYAHRFRVFMPAAWVRTADDERMVRRALDTEKPAHTRYDLCLIEPRFRVGLQSSVGLDTIIGAYPVARLACTEERDVPPSRPPRNRLGYDTILGCPPDRGAGFQVTPETRLGLDTRLT